MIKVGDEVKISDWFYLVYERNKIKKIIKTEPCEHKDSCDFYLKNQCQGDWISIKDLNENGCWGYGTRYAISKVNDKYDKFVENMKNA